jgi:hypothetical protein
MRRIIVIAALILAAALVFDVYPGLRGGAGWQWPYEPPPDALPVAVLALGLAVYIGGMLMLCRRSVRGALAWAVFGGTALAYLVVGVRGDPFFLLFTRTVSPVQTGASALQARIMARDGVLPTLKRWPQVMDEALDQNLIHFTTSPPGQPLLHQAAADLFDTPALAGVAAPLSRTLRLYQCGDIDVMRYTRGEIVSAGLLAFLMPLFAALTALPLYAIARDLTGDRRLAVSAAAWWPLVPAALLFAPTWNTLYPLLCTAAFWLLLRGLITGRLRWAFASGLVMGGATFLNFSVLPFFLLAGLFTLLWHWQKERITEHTEVHSESGRLTSGGSRTAPTGFSDYSGNSVGAVHEPPTNGGRIRPSNIAKVRRATFIGLVFGVGVLVPWLVYTLVTGVSPLDIFGTTFGAHSELVRRDYLPWLILHPYDVLLFTGLPAALLTVWGVVRVVRSRRLDALGLFVLAMATTVLLVTLAGIVQGENARILIFYMPFLIVVGLAARRDASDDAPLLGAQAVVLLAMAAVLAVVSLDLNPMPDGPRTDIGGLGDVPWTDGGAPFASVAYMGEFTLGRYRWVGDPSRQAITYEFEFVGGAPTERPYQFELVARADTDEGEIVSEPFRWWSQGEEYPPTCWRNAEVIRDTIVLPLPPVPHPVVWEVILRAVDERTGDVMLISGRDAHSLAPVSYP